MNDDDIDYEQAAQELLIEAKQGNAESQCLLGQMYYEGVGVRQDYKQSALWFTKAAKHKHAEAQYFLGLQYQNGQGVKQNRMEAEAWFQRAAKLGNVDAKAVLAEIAKSKAKASPLLPNTVNVNSVPSVSANAQSPKIKDDGDSTVKETGKALEKPSELPKTEEQKPSEKSIVASSDETKVSESSTPPANVPEPQPVPVINTKKKIITIIAILIILSVAGIAGYFEYSRVMQNEAKLKHEEELTKYKNNLYSAVEEMSLGIVWAESASSLIHDVWYNSIHQKRSYKTDKYTTDYGIFYDDFNTALQKLMSSSEFTSKISLVKISQLSTEVWMKSLKNPTEEFKSAYSVLLDLYGAYTELNNLAISPTGTLVSYTTNWNNAYAAFLKYQKMIQIYH